MLGRRVGWWGKGMGEELLETETSEDESGRYVNLWGRWMVVVRGGGRGVLRNGNQ